MVRHCNRTNSGSGNDEMTLRELSEETLAGYDVFLDATMSGRRKWQLTPVFLFALPIEAVPTKGLPDS